MQENIDNNEFEYEEEFVGNEHLFSHLSFESLPIHSYETNCFYSGV